MNPHGDRSIAPCDVLAGRYRIEQLLASGGMGEVFEAFDCDLEIPVALKVIRAEFASTAESLRAFKREVLMARSIYAEWSPDRPA